MAEGKKKRSLLIMIIMALMVTLCILCGNLFYESLKNNSVDSETEESQTEIQLVYAYQNPQWNSAIEQTVKRFEEEYPNIKVNYEVNYEDKVYEDILIKKIARNELGDIVQLKNPGSYASSDTLGAISDEVIDLVTLTYEKDGVVYGTGAVEATSGILYNKEIFERYGLQVPETYAEFLEVCEKLKQCGVTPIGVAGSDLWHMEYWVNHYFRTDVISKNIDWLQSCKNGEVSWLDEEPKKMLTDLQELFVKGYVNTDWQTIRDSALSYKMAENEIAMIYTGPWTAITIQKLNSEMELGWFFVPNENGLTYVGDNRDTYWSVTKQCEEDPEKYEAAMKFLKFFYSQDNYISVCKDTYTFPLTLECTVTEMETLQREIDNAYRSSDEKIATYVGDENTPENFEKNMLLLMMDCLDGSATVEDTQKSIQTLWNQCMSNQEEEP